MTEKTKERPLFELKPLAGKHYLIKNPEIIQIRTIKAKHVDEMDQLNFKYGVKYTDESFQVLGRHDPYIIVRWQNTFYRIHKNDYADLLLEERGEEFQKSFKDTKEMYNATVEWIRKEIPQLFSS